mmetsp:Transcript_25154/g.38913  ORF Transcript_25154/g.38913 Transcript_25154/m.38913 type:complete len:328 (-) Transcript_25154:1248-2231(-)
MEEEDTATAVVCTVVEPWSPPLPHQAPMVDMVLVHLQHQDPMEHHSSSSSNMVHQCQCMVSRNRLLPQQHPLYRMPVAAIPLVPRRPCLLLLLLLLLPLPVSTPLVMWPLLLLLLLLLLLVVVWIPLARPLVLLLHPHLHRVLVWTPLLLLLLFHPLLLLLHLLPLLLLLLPLLLVIPLVVEPWYLLVHPPVLLRETSMPSLVSALLLPLPLLLYPYLLLRIHLVLLLRHPLQLLLLQPMRIPWQALAMTLASLLLLVVVEVSFLLLRIPTLQRVQQYQHAKRANSPPVANTTMPRSSHPHSVSCSSSHKNSRTPSFCRQRRRLWRH